MKRYALLFLALFAVIVTFSSCSNVKDGKLDPNEPVMLSLWNYYHGPQKNAFDEMVNEFNQTVGLELGIIVESHSYAGVAELASSVMNAAIDNVGADTMPDIFLAYADNALQLDSLGVLANIEEYLTKDELDLYIESYIKEGYINQNENLKIFPTAKATEIAMLNKTDFDAFVNETGLSIKYEDLQTYKGIITLAELYYNWTDLKTPDIENDGKAFFGLDSVANFIYVTSQQMEKDLFVLDNGKITSNYDKESMRKIWDIYYTNMIKGYFLSKARFRSDDAKTGDILLLVGSTTSAAYFPTQVTDIYGNSHSVEMKAITMPVISGGVNVAIQQGAGMCVTKSDEKSEYASIVFIKWFTDPVRNIEFSMNSGGYMPVTKKGMESEEIKQLLDARLVADKNQDASQAVYYENTAKVVECFIKQYNSYELFTPVVFNSSDKIRVLLDDFGRFTLSSVEEAWHRINNGEPYADIINEYCSDSAFEQWYTSFDSNVSEIID